MHIATLLSVVLRCLEEAQCTKEVVAFRSFNHFSTVRMYVWPCILADTPTRYDDTTSV